MGSRDDVRERVHGRRLRRDLRTGCDAVLAQRAGGACGDVQHDRPVEHDDVSVRMHGRSLHVRPSTLYGNSLSEWSLLHQFERVRLLQRYTDAVLPP